MILSRRSFLKVAGLSAVAVAGASMFTGCNVNNLFSTSVVYVAKDGQEISDDLIKALNESKFANAVPGHSDLYSNDPDKCKKAVQNKVAVVPGNAFLTDENAPCLSFRLNYSTPTDEQIEQGVDILATVAKTMYR